MTPTLSDLLERVKAASGPDRELDAVIAKHAAGLNFGWCNGDDWTCGKQDCPGCGEPLGLVDDRKSYPIDWREDIRLPLYTASVDAALALVERLLPGWTVARMSQGDNKLWTVEVREGFLTSYGKVVIQPDHWQGTTAPLAILAALLTALQASPAAMENTDDDK